MIISVALLGLGFIFTHSTLLTRATEFALKARGAAMSLVAFCFMGGGGVGYCHWRENYFSLENWHAILDLRYRSCHYIVLSFIMIRDHVVEPDEKKEEVGNL